jgi:hypothetical protein
MPESFEFLLDLENEKFDTHNFTGWMELEYFKRWSSYLFRKLEIITKPDGQILIDSLI